MSKVTVFALISSMVFLSLYFSVPAFAEINVVHVSVGDGKHIFVYFQTDPIKVTVDECLKDASGNWHCNNIAHDRNIPVELKDALDKATLSPDSAANPTNHKNSTSTKGLNEPGIRIGDGGLTIQK